MKSNSETSQPIKKVTKKPAKTTKPLFPYSDWITIVMGVIFLSQTNGMGHHLGHAGIFLLMITLIARPISFWWNQPLKHRRALGILAFATALAHSIYALNHVLNSKLNTVFQMAHRHQWGIWTGIIALAAITPAAITSFPILQKKLGRTWKKIHLLTVPAIAFATSHTILVGPHYMAEIQMGQWDYCRTYGIIIATFLVLLIRRRIFWSILGLKK